MYNHKKYINVYWATSGRSIARLALLLPIIPIKDLRLNTDSWYGIFSFRFESGEENLLNNGREFDERYHWHSLKPLSDDYDKAKKLITGNDHRTFSMFIEFS